MKKRIGIIIILIIGVFTIYQYAIQKYYEYMINRDFNLNIKGGNIELISREEEWLDNGDGEKLLVFKINNLYLENVNNINTLPIKENLPVNNIPLKIIKLEQGYYKYEVENRDSRDFRIIIIDNINKYVCVLSNNVNI